ncbi:MAG TPA: hypothetical protein VNJ07_02570 [Chitinophagales bacterium]|nr:hypothetical protein [Chitinophagales bacterium]
MKKLRIANCGLQIAPSCHPEQSQGVTLHAPSFDKRRMTANRQFRESANYPAAFSRWLLLLLSILSAAPLFPQTLSYSIPKKLSSKTPEFRILGKNKEGVLVYKYGRSTHVIEAYGNKLNVRWEKSLTFKYNASSVKRIVIYPEKTLAFYLSDQKGVPVLFAEKWNGKFSGEGNAVLIDSVNSGKFDAESTVRVAVSQNQSKMVCYYPVSESEEYAERVRLIIADGELNILARKDIPISKSGMLLRKVFPDNEGNVFILLEDENKSRKKASTADAFTVKMYETASEIVRELDFHFQRPIFRKLYMDMDNVNKNLIATGFYTDDAGEEAQGYFYSVYDLDSGVLRTNQYMKFSHDLIFEVTGKDTSRNFNGFYSFEVNDLVMRFDGGAIIIAESRFDTEENMQVPSFTPSIGPSFRTINISYYNDIMLLSVAPDGTLDWSMVLKKKQISEDDDGFFSSYCLATTGGKLHFVYNEEIYQKTNVSEYEVDKAGHSERQYLFNAGDRNVLLAPKLGKQISTNEILIPSYKRNYLSFVKVTY